MSWSCELLFTNSSCCFSVNLLKLGSGANVIGKIEQSRKSDCRPQRRRIPLQWRQCDKTQCLRGHCELFLFSRQKRCRFGRSSALHHIAENERYHHHRSWRNKLPKIQCIAMDGRFECSCWRDWPNKLWKSNYRFWLNSKLAKLSNTSVIYCQRYIN